MRGIKFPIVSEYNPKGFKQATKGVSHFKKSLGGLKGALGGLGLALGAGQLGRFGMEAAKAAQADLKSQSLLAEGLKRSTKANKSQIASSEAFIQKISMQSGVLDDELRPALADLARTTHNTKKAQDLLQISLDAATMKGVSTTKVQTAIAKAYNGSTTALSRAFPELKKVQLAYEQQHGKVKKLADATEVGRLMIQALAKESKGMAAEQATPFDKINVAADDMKEKLGNLILPKLTDFMNDLMKPNGAVEKLGQFLQDSGNPKTDAGKAFKDMGDGMKAATDGVNTFFTAFDPKKQSGVAGFLAVMGFLGNSAKAVGNFIGGKGEVYVMNPRTGQLEYATGKNNPSKNKSITTSPMGGSGGRGGAGSGGGGGTGSGYAGITINITGKATAADGDAVVQAIKNYERKNGTAWRKP